MIIANMTPEEIDNASKLSDVEEIGYYEEPEISEPSVDRDEGIGAREAMGLPKVYEKLGLSGKNVNVALIESYLPGPVPNEELEIDLSKVIVAEDPNYVISPSINQVDKIIAIHIILLELWLVHKRVLQKILICMLQIYVFQMLKLY